jgi:carbon monoxide dehydrogenase subunit G
MKTPPVAFLVCTLFMASAWAQTPVNAVKPLGKLPAREEPASPESLEIAQRVHVGSIPCELGATVHLSRDPASPGYFHVHGKGFRYRMKAVVTSTGAVRLEDQKAGAVWLQLANKSMLMNQKSGRRMADDCAHPDQVAFAKDMLNNPPPALFDTTGMGR